MVPKQKRSEVESRVRAIVAENQRVEDALPEDIPEEERWKRFREKVRPSTLYVRRLHPEEDHIDRQVLMYLVDTKEVDGVLVVIMTYAEGGSVGEFFEVEISRIVAVE